MNASSIIAVSLVGMLIAACATGYQSAGPTGGFNDAQLAPDVFRVSFSGNGYTSSDRAQDFALLRAAELTLANNFKYFAVTDSSEQSRGGIGVGLMIRSFPTKPEGIFAYDAEFIAKSIRTKYRIK